MKHDVYTLTTELKRLVAETNSIIEELHNHNVEVRIQFKDYKDGKSASLDLWRLVEHIDYLT